MSDYDVVIVGGGAAGLAAALAAADEGARTIVVEAGSRLGGSAAMSGGVIYAAGTSIQAAAGLSDSAEAMYRYFMILNRFELNAGLVRRLCDESGPAVEWLISLGVEFPISLLYAAGLDGVRRGHQACGGGDAIMSTLDRHVSSHPSIDVAVGNRVTGLVSSGGRVCGVTVGDDAISCEAVILTTGGFGANPELIARLLPATARYGDALWYIGSPYCRGDGIALGESLGAEVTGIDDVTPLLTPGFARDFEPFLPGWFMFVGHDGRRFADETISYSVSGRLLRQLPGGECLAVFDEKARTGESVETMMSDEFPVQSWSAERLQAMADAGQIVRAASLGELASAAGIDGPRLQATVDEYNRYCDEGVDQAYFKDPALLRPIRTPPFYAVRIKPSVIGVTGAGLACDREARVLDRAGRPIAGLFAAGETVGGLMGACYIGGGGSLASAFVFGRISGRTAARCRGTAAPGLATAKAQQVFTA